MANAIPAVAGHLFDFVVCAALRRKVGVTAHRPVIGVLNRLLVSFTFKGGLVNFQINNRFSLADRVRLPSFAR